MGRATGSHQADKQMPLAQKGLLQEGQPEETGPESGGALRSWPIVPTLVG